VAKKSREQRKHERGRGALPAAPASTPSSGESPASDRPSAAAARPIAHERPAFKAKAHAPVEEPDASPRRHDAEIAAARAARAAHVPPRKKRGNPALVLAGLVALAGLIVWLAQRPSTPEPEPVTAESTKLAAPPEAAIPRPPVAASSVELDLMPSPHEAPTAAEKKPAEAKPAEAKPAETKPADAKAADAKAADAKPVNAKAADAKPAPKKPAPTKPVPAPAPAPPPTSDDVY
jgi:hypothetical protein